MRNYGQFCPIARGSAILAERWTPIILRNLLLGCRTFNEIAAGAPGLSRALLTRRLHELERAGLVEIRPKPNGHGSLYQPTPAGRDLWGVLLALGDWAERWVGVTAEHTDPDVILWSWCQYLLRRDRLPDRRVVVRFEFPVRDRRSTLWLLLERRQGEVCQVDPGFGDDLVVVVSDPLAFARWHLGLLEWGAALRSGGIEVSGPTHLRRQLPTWNAGPEAHGWLRAEHERAPDSAPAPLPLEALPESPRRPAVARRDGHRSRPTTVPGFGGQLLSAGDPGYDEARTVWNGAVDRRPRHVARCRSSADVAAALRFARDRGLAVSVRGGGHGVAGTAVHDGGLVVDLGPMKAVQVDPARATATAQAGVLWRELDATTQAFGLATTGGAASHVGVSGHTLGGGMGWLMRRHGLTVDNLLAAEVVTGDHERLVASEREHPELFWGLRGGGGGLGVATSFTYRLHPVGPDVLAGPVLWALEDAVEVLRAYRAFAASAPPEVGTAVTLWRAHPAPFLPVELHRRPVCMVVMLALGPPEAAERLLAPLRGVGRPLLDLVKRRPYGGLQSLTDDAVPCGWHYYWKSTGLRDLGDGVIEALVDHAGRAGSPRSAVQLLHLGGAVAEADPAATACSRRGVPFELLANAAWLPGQPVAEAERAWARSLVAALGPHRAGAYLNFLDGDDQERTAFSPATYERLLGLRRRFDPDGVLRARTEAPAVPGRA